MKDPMHLEDEQVQRLLHGELGGAETSVRDHLGGCPECRSRLAEAEREEQWVLDRIRRLDHGQPRVSLEDVVAANARRAPAWGRLAAGIFLALVAAGVAYAAPGSPLPRVIDRLIQLMSPARDAAVDTTGSRPAAESHAGIAVEPGERLTIELAPGQALDTVVVSLSNGAEVVVRARGGTTTFTSDPDRLAVKHAGEPGTLEIQVPRASPLVELRMGSYRLWLKQGSRITSEVPPDSEGRYRLPLTFPNRRSR
jgi:hypothetical protein